MDLHYLRIFYEVAKEKSFTKAAKNLYINQSAVSIQIKRFEEILNTKLFDRSSKQIKLTYTGEALFKMATDIFEKVKRSEKELLRIIELDSAKISIGVTSVIGEPLLPKLLKEFSAVHSEIEYEVTVGEKNWLINLLKEGSLDILIIDETHITDQSLDVTTVEKMPYVLVGINKLKNMEKIAKLPLITRGEIYNNNRAIAIIEEKYKVSFETKINVNGNLELIKGMVREGIGNVILPYYAVYKELQCGEFDLLCKVDDITDGYQIVVTEDKKNLIQIIKLTNFIKEYKLK